ncbi:MAG TPA: zinc-dependent metalloprotease [Phycisphaerae bacterium]
MFTRVQRAIDQKSLGRFSAWAGSLVAAMAMASLAWADNPTPRSGKDDGAADKAAKVAATAEPAEGDKEKDKDKDKDKPDYPKFEEATKDYSLMPVITQKEGAQPFLPLYYSEKKDSLLAVIPKNMLGKNFLMAASIAAGPDFAGWMWDDHVVKFEERDKKLVLIEPDLRFKRGEKSTVEDVINRTYTDTIVAAVPIVTKKGNDPVIELDKVFKTDLAGISQIYGGNMDASLSRWAERKCFEKNVELTVNAALMRPREGGTQAAVHYSISELPNTDYKPREADERVGYFLTAVKDWNRSHSDKTLFRRYIHRWNLRKADPKAEVSDVDPDTQIKFYIEKTVPVQYRRYVREGILEWNKAFEAAGIRNAVAVFQQTDKSYADLDPEDVNFNFFRWIVSGRSFAMGPSRANPLTGQIYDADIIFDDSMARVWEQQYAVLSAKGPAAMFDPQLSAFLEAHPEWNFVTREAALLGVGTHVASPLVGGAGVPAPGTRPDATGLLSVCGVDTTIPPAVMARLSQQQGFCTYADGLMHEMAFNGALLKATGNANMAEEFVGQMIKEVAMHEVGHTLGLRHNFKASSWLSLDKIMAIKDTGQATCGSVMDYNPGMFALNKEEQADFVTQTLGPYDIWAIQFGYSQPKDGQKEEDLIKSITSRAGEAGLDYATDEDTGVFAPDPLVNRFDNGDDPIAYARQRMAMVEALRKDMVNWAVDDGESYNRLRKTFDMLLFEYGRCSQYVARQLGGQYLNREHKGDPKGREPVIIVPPEKQRAALDFLVERIFSDQAFRFDPAVLNKLAAGRWGHWDSDEFDTQLDYPLHDRIASIQYWSLFYVLNPYTISRVYDSELKVPADQDTVTVPEIVTRTTAAIWSELKEQPNGKTFTNRQPYISSIRRSLQRQHLSMLLNLAVQEPDRRLMPADVHAVARQTLKGLSDQLGLVVSRSGAGLDDFCRAHLDECKTRIDKALDAQFIIR